MLNAASWQQVKMSPIVVVGAFAAGIGAAGEVIRQLYFIQPVRRLSIITLAQAAIFISFPEQMDISDGTKVWVP